MQDEYAAARKLATATRVHLQLESIVAKRFNYNAGKLSIGNRNELDGFCSLYLSPVSLIGISYYELVVSFEGNSRLEIGINIEQNKKYDGFRSSKGTIVMDW